MPNSELPPRDPAYFTGEEYRTAPGAMIQRLTDQVGSLQSELKEWKYRATHDELTGLLNTTGFALELAQTSPPRAVIYTDGTIKPVNDTLGHEAGDKIIKDTAKILKSSKRPEDRAARIGGDEMVILLGSTDRDQEPTSPEDQLRVVGARIGNLLLNYLNDDENKPVRDAGFMLAVGGAVWKEGMTTNDLIAKAETDMRNKKAEQYRERGYKR